MPSKEQLAAPLAHPSVAAARLQFAEVGERLVGRWVIPWGWVVFTFVLTTGSITAGALTANQFGKLGDGETKVILWLVWGLFAPLLLLGFFWILRRAQRNPEHVVIDRAQQFLQVATKRGELRSIAFEQVRAFVAVSRAVKIATGSSGPASRWTRRLELSLLHAEPGGLLVQTSLYAIQDEGKRLVELRQHSDQIPRILNCERLYVTLDRAGNVRGGSDSA